MSALDALRINKVDFIISDIGLPDISGIELTTRIRALEKEEGKVHLPIAGLSAHATDDTIREARTAGMQCVVEKPLTNALLMQLISELIAPIANETDHIENAPLNSAFSVDKFPLLDEGAGIALLGSPDVLNDLLTILINDEIPTAKKELNEVYALHDRQQLHALSHKLKSGAIYCGTTRLQQACQALENYLKGHDTALDEALYTQLLTVIDQTEAAAIAWLKQNK